MKKKGISLLFFIGSFLLLSYSCKPKVISEITDLEKNEISKEIESIVNNFFNPNLNYESYIDLRADKDGYLVASDGKILFTDYESFVEAVKSRFDNIQQIVEMECTKTYVYVLANDAAVSTSEFHEKYLMASGDTIVRNGS